MSEKSIHQQMADCGVQVAHHESDLYVPVTPETKAVVAAYRFRSIVTIFTNQVEGGPWYDIPFAYDPEIGDQEEQA